jgi:phosphatidylglycerol:prolipoprotein diacylglycerol transferase
MARRGALRAGLSPRRAVDALAIAMLSALVFGRLAEVVYYPEQLAADWRILLPWRGGYTSLGVFLGTAVALAAVGRRASRVLYWRTLDVLAPAALLGAAVVRIGCFLGHHHAGRLSGMPGAVAYPGGARYDLGLCEALLLFAIVGALALFERRRFLATGWIATVGATAYAIGRFALEFLRADDLASIGRRSDARFLGLTLVQYATALIAVAGLGWMWRQREKRNGV